MPGCGGWRSGLRTVQSLSRLLPAGPDETHSSPKHFSPGWTTEQGSPAPEDRSPHIRDHFLWRSWQGGRGSWGQHTGRVLALHLL